MNATITVAGQSGQANFTVTLSESPTSVTIAVTRQRPAEAVQVPFVAVDQCDSWNTFVGGGPTAF